jgi:hypothetical protein
LVVHVPDVRELQSNLGEGVVNVSEGVPNGASTSRQLDASTARLNASTFSCGVVLQYPAAS